MSKINILPAQVYNRIAAGEVVDRPYSVVKELVENAIDAGATQIEIYVEKGGKQLVRVVDNGCGIGADDLHAAFLPHATSKIAKAEDLEKVLTLGFRGEAVASIASVSKMTITSKTADGDCFSLTSDGGKVGEITRAAGDNGTDVKVEMLFFNTPVRLGFLKSDKAEEADITTFVSRFMLGHPEISFTYFVNGKKTLQTFGGGEEEAIVGIYGASILQNTYKIDAKKHGIRIYGYISNQNYSKPNKTYQCVFLNGRYISNTTISAAISNAYNSYLMKRQYPFYVLHLEIPAEIVDVNVHPNKADVRFADNQIIYGCIYSVISSVLDGNSKALEYIVDTSPKGVVVPQEETEKVVVPQEPTAFTYQEAREEMARNASIIPPQTDEEPQEREMTREERLAERCRLGNRYFTTPAPRATFVPTEPKVELPLAEKFPGLYRDPDTTTVGEDRRQLSVFEENKLLLKKQEMRQQQLPISTSRYVGKAFNTYLFFEKDEDLYIIDQHAAHERVLFDKLREDMRRRKVMQQPLLLSYKVEVNAWEANFIRENLSYLREVGFVIDEFGDTAFKVEAVPVDLQGIDLTRFFNALLGEVAGIRAIRLPDLLRDKLASEACKYAVKGGRDITEEEIDELFRKLDGDMGLKCPHGRPVVIKMTKIQIEKMFKRIV